MSQVDFFSVNKGIVTLCGSTKFFEECVEVNRQLTFKGWIVLMCGSWGHSYHKGKDIKKTPEEFKMVKLLHFSKILMSQAVVVVSDKSMYYGNSTRAEIAFSKFHNTPIFYFDGEVISKDESNKPVNVFNTLLPFESVINKYKGDLGF